MLRHSGGRLASHVRKSLMRFGRSYPGNSGSGGMVRRHSASPSQSATTALADPGLRRTLEDLGLNAAGAEPGQLRRAIAEDMTLYRSIVAQANIRIE